MNSFKKLSQTLGKQSQQLKQTMSGSAKEIARYLTQTPSKMKAGLVKSVHAAAIAATLASCSDSDEQKYRIFGGPVSNPADPVVVQKYSSSEKQTHNETFTHKELKEITHIIGQGEGKIGFKIDENAQKIIYTNQNFVDAGIGNIVLDIGANTMSFDITSKGDTNTFMFPLDPRKLGENDKVNRIANAGIVLRETVKMTAQLRNTRDNTSDAYGFWSVQDGEISFDEKKSWIDYITFDWGAKEVKDLSETEGKKIYDIYRPLRKNKNLREEFEKRLNNLAVWKKEYGQDE